MSDFHLLILTVMKRTFKKLQLRIIKHAKTLSQIIFQIRFSLIMIMGDAGFSAK